ncbi:MAG: ABC transporter ATP-binding protein [Desulfosporosinus sp.]|nr:ABC transporter ATP-binding protein [Desulfosporosinus sp.]
MIKAPNLREDVSPLLSVQDLKTYFRKEEGGSVKAVDGVSLHIRKKEILGVVGESGSGKSITALSILRLFPSPPGYIAGGDILFENQSLLAKTQKEMRLIRGKDISMVFQEPMSSLNPAYTVGYQIRENIQLHQNVTKKEALDHAVDMLRLVGIASPEKRVHDYPFQMSGGMRQRVMVAMALSCQPKLLIADEPTTALDVTIQAQILRLILETREKVGSAIMLITHDLGVVAEVCERVVVMYSGKVLEVAYVNDLFNHPAHPYTQGLLQAIPRLDDTRDRLSIIPGSIPNPANLPEGCRFYPRCQYAEERCQTEQPPLVSPKPSQWVSCWRVAGEKEMDSDAIAATAAKAPLNV